MRKLYKIMKDIFVVLHLYKLLFSPFMSMGEQFLACRDLSTIARNAEVGKSCASALCRV